MKKTTGIKLINLALLTISIALFSMGILDQARQNIHRRQEAKLQRLNTAHNDIARYYALSQTAKLP